MAIVALEPFKNRLLKLIGFQIKRVDDIMFALALMAASTWFTVRLLPAYAP